MNQITIHESDTALVEQITLFANQYGIRPEEAARKLLHWAINHADYSSIENESHSCSKSTAFKIESAKEFRTKFAHLQTTDSVDLIREDRDR
jgi:hypothetical protein